MVRTLLLNSDALPELSGLALVRLVNNDIFRLFCLDSISILFNLLNENDMFRIYVRIYIHSLDDYISKYVCMNVRTYIRRDNTNMYVYVHTYLRTYTRI